MDRMLGNKYFISRKFTQAIHHLEKVRTLHPDDMSVLRKLTISYLAQQQVEQALDTLAHLLKIAPETYFHSEKKEPNCPCIELLEKWIVTPPENFSQVEYFTAMGILNFFSGNRHAIGYLQAVREHKPGLHIIDRLFDQIRKATH